MKLTRPILVLLTVFGLPLIGVAQAPCQAPLDDDTINSLFFGTPYDSLEVQPGQTIDLGLYDSFLNEVDACVEWSVSPDVESAITPDTGVLRVGPTPISYPLTVTANVENCRRILRIRVYVYQAAASPEIGAWREVERYGCNGKRIRGGSPIQLLVLRADGSFYVTFMPFEYGYSDYWGRYVADPESNGFSFKIVGRNQWPEHTDKYGRYRIDRQGRLVFEGVSFGDVGNGSHQACKYVFERTDYGRPAPN